MEAMWTRFLPAMAKIAELTREQGVGPIQAMMADFGIRGPFNLASRVFDPDPGGGALLDLGTSCVPLASQIFGTADRIAAPGHVGPTQVDERTGLVLANEGGKMAVFMVAITLETPQEAVLVGTQGHSRINAPWWRPQSFTVSRTGEAPEDHQALTMATVMVIWRPRSCDAYRLARRKAASCG